MSVKRSKPVRRELSPVGEGVVAGLKEVLVHVRGERKLPSRTYNVPGPVDVKAIRAATGLSQSEFSRRYGFTLRTLQDWELGRGNPPSPVRAYLIVIREYPKTVDKALGGTAA